MVEEKDKESSHVEKEHIVRVTNPVEFICEWNTHRYVWKEMWIPFICRQKVKCGNNNHVVVQNESISRELDIYKRRVDDNLQVVDHAPNLIKRAG